MSLIFYKFLKFYFLSFVFVVAGVTLVKFVVGGLSTVLLCGVSANPANPACFIFFRVCKVK